MKKNKMSKSAFDKFRDKQIALIQRKIQVDQTKSKLDKRTK